MRRPNALSLLGAVLLSAVALLGPALSVAAEPANDAEVDANVAAAIGPRISTLTPAAIPLSADVDIANPMRGMQGYLGGDQPLTDGSPFVDSYSRDNLFWYELEPSEGVYDFSQLDRYLAEAAAHGGKYGFRIMSVDYSSARHRGAFVPKYLWDRMSGAYQWTTGDGTLYMPDFDDPNFLARARALIAAIGARYGNDPRLGWVEPGFMGLYGEWHVGNAPKITRGTLAHQAWTVDTGKQIVDAWRAALPNTRLIMLTADFEVLDYALGLDPSIGWRHDCLGSPNLDSLQQNPGYTNHADQWKTAPVFWESCGSNVSVALSRDQVIRYHFAGGHPMNGPQLAKLSPADQAALKDYRKLAGYRFQVDNVLVPANLVSGAPFAVATEWSNVGLTPAYTPWSVRLQLRARGSDNAVWEGASSVDLQSLLPTRDPNSGQDNPQPVIDSFNLSGVPAGDYDMTVLVSDPSGYYAPLQLADQGRRSDGSYLVGSVTVNS